MKKIFCIMFLILSFYAYSQDIFPGENKIWEEIRTKFIQFEQDFTNSSFTNNVYKNHKQMISYSLYSISNRNLFQPNNYNFNLIDVKLAEMLIEYIMYYPNELKTVMPILINLIYADPSQITIIQKLSEFETLTKHQVEVIIKNEFDNVIEKLEKVTDSSPPNMGLTLMYSFWTFETYEKIFPYKDYCEIEEKWIKWLLTR